mgnify:CR=1 FL=1
MATRRNLKSTNTTETMKTKISCIALALAGIVAASKNKGAARDFLEWLASESVQADFASINYEIPAREGVALDPVVAAWGPFKPDPVNVTVAGKRQAEAVRLMDRAGWR